MDAKNRIGAIKPGTFADLVAVCGDLLLSPPLFPDSVGTLDIR